MMLTRAFLPVSASRLRRSSSTAAPCLPMTMPGLAVWMVSLTSFRLRSISARLTLALERRRLSRARMSRSSASNWAYALRGAYHLLSQSLMTPSRKPMGWTFCPISSSLSSAARALGGRLVVHDDGDVRRPALDDPGLAAGLGPVHRRVGRALIGRRADHAQGGRIEAVVVLGV